MYVELEGFFDEKGGIEILDKKSMAIFKDAHKPGDVIRVRFDDSVETQNEKSFRIFHVYRDQYAVSQGLEKEYAKALLKFRHGAGVIPWRPNFKPPIGEEGRFLEAEDRIYWMKSTKAYTDEELAVLIEGTISDINQPKDEA